MSMRHKNIKQQDERGFASMVVALTLVIVLALITIGFAQLTRREQQNALNKQLATQANYAAETGINDAIKFLRANPGYVNALGATKCVPQADISDFSQDIDTNNGVSYSCLILNTQPKSLQFTDVQPGDTESVVFRTTTAPNPLKIEWESDRSSAPVSDAGFPPITSWAYPAVLQFSITPLGNGTGLTRTNLVNSTFNSFLYPTTSGVGSAAFTGNAGYSSKTMARCVPSGSGSRCTANITGMGVGSYLLSFLDLYDKSNNVTLTAGGGNVEFIGGQALIDVTGKARDVLKRLQVRVCLNANNCQSLPATEGQNICKRLDTQPGGTTFASLPGVPAAACDLSTGGGVAGGQIQNGPASIPTQIPNLLPPSSYTCQIIDSGINGGVDGIPFCTEN